MLYDNYFEEMEGIFKHLDLHKKGMVNKDEIMEAVRKLRDPSIAETHEMRVPEADDLDIILSDKGSLINYDEFLTAVYKCTLENYGE
jgi:Ca2+-binding EF-hand superfamily protein